MSPCLLGAVAWLFMRKFPAAFRTFAWLFTRLPDENSSGHGPDSSADLLQMDETEGDMVNRRPSSLAMLMATCQQVYSRPQAISTVLLMTFSSLLGCGLYTGVLSEVLRYLLPGEGTAPASVSGAETTSQLQKVVLDPISGHDLSRHADPVSSVPCKSDCDVGRESPQDYRGVFFHPRIPQLLSGVIFWATFRLLLFW